MSTAFLPDELQRVAVALLVGFLIGLDRERAEACKTHRQFAGVRTFPLIALVGAIPVLVRETTGPWLLLVAFLAVAAVTLVSYVRTSVDGSTGATTEIASFATFLLGALAGDGQLLLAGSLGIAVAVLLVAKPPLENFSRGLSETELAGALELAVIAGIILPLVPNRDIGPWGVWNPFSIWLVVVLVSAVSFAGFVAVRALGEQRGMALAGLVGGLVSSTAVTGAMAQRSREEPAAARPAAAAAVLASIVMCGRMVVFCATFGPGIVPRILPPLAAIAVTGGIAAWWILRGTRSQATCAASVPNPSNLFAAVGFALLYAVIVLGVRAATEWFGDAGMYAASALSAFVDVDAITIAFARGGPGADEWRTAALAVAIAASSNTLFKLGLSVFLGAGAFRPLAAAAMGVMTVAGTVTAVLVYLA